MPINWTTLTKWGVRIGAPVLAFFTLWAALAQIAPKLFGIDVDRKTAMKYLAFDPSWLRFIIPLAVLWLLWAIWGIYRRLDVHEQAAMDSRTAVEQRIGEQIKAHDEKFQKVLTEVLKLESTFNDLIQKRIEQVNERVTDTVNQIERMRDFVTGADGLTRAIVRLNLHEGQLTAMQEQIERLSDFIRVGEGLTGVVAKLDNYQEIIFKEPDGRVWTFQDIDGMSADEQEALRRAKPEVWRKYRGRLFYDVIFPPSRPAP